MMNILWVNHPVHVYALAHRIETLESSNEIVVDVVQPSLQAPDVAHELPDQQERLAVAVHQTLPIDQTQLCDVLDVCAMNNLHEAALLDLIRRRFSRGQIYTNVGSLLLSVNPYTPIDGLYDSPGQFLAVNGECPTNQQPHVYSIANAALRNLIQAGCGSGFGFGSGSDSGSAYTDSGSSTISTASPIASERFRSGRVESLSGSVEATLGTPGKPHIIGTENQAVIITGESGAGKTEASKWIIAFLTQVSGCGAIGCDTEDDHSSSRNILSAISSREQKRQVGDHGVAYSRSTGSRVKELLFDSNHIFEAFGNAKTIHNANSSRFGKFTRLEYSNNSSSNTRAEGRKSSNSSSSTSDTQLVAASTETFLLERSRLVSANIGERNFHIFYDLVSGIKTANAEQARRYRLSGCADFNMLNNAPSAGSEEEQELGLRFQRVYSALGTIGCSTAELEAIVGVLSVILHLGNVSTVSSPAVNTSVHLDSPTMPLEGIAQILGVPTEMFVSSLTTEELWLVSTRESALLKYLGSVEVQNNIKALMKWLYRNLFEWILKKVNYAHSSILRDLQALKHASTKFIGVLDIFGFEIYANNSFEQLCINFASEKLQQFSNKKLFVVEQAMYQSEDIDWATIAFRDNQGIIDLFGKRPSGVFSVLEEHNALNRQDHSAVLTALIHAHDKKNELFERAKLGRPGFIIKHFVGDALYLVDDLLSKNNDALQGDLLQLFELSDNEFIQHAMLQRVLPAEGFEGMGGNGVDDPGETPGAHRPGYIPDIQRPTSFSSTNASAAASYGVATGAGTGVGMGMGSHRRRSTKRMASTFTVSFQFRRQLDSLISALEATNPHHIKCIKSNSEQVAARFDSALVMQQLRYNDVLGLAILQQKGFPTKIDIRKLYSENRVLWLDRTWSPAKHSSDDTIRSHVIALLGRYLPPSTYQVGRRIVFLQNEAVAGLRAAVMLAARPCVTRIQTCWRRAREVRSLARVLRGIRLLQRSWRDKLTLRLHCTATILQSMWRRRCAMKRRSLMLTSCLIIQTNMRLRLSSWRVRASTKQRIQAEKDRNGQLNEQRDNGSRRIQCVWRRAVRRWKTTAVTVIARAWLTTHTRRKFCKTIASARRIQIFWRSMVAIKAAYATAKSIQDACFQGEFETACALAAEHRLLLRQHSSSLAFGPMMHAAVCAGQVELVRELPLQFKDLLHVDGKGNSLLHSACGQGRLDTAKLILRLIDNHVNTVTSNHVNTVTSTSTARATSSEEATTDTQAVTIRSRSRSSKCDLRIEHNHINNDDDDETSMDDPISHINEFLGEFWDASFLRGQPVVKSGWLQVFEPGRFVSYKPLKRRWVVLTEDAIEVFDSETAKAAPLKAVSVGVCVVRRLEEQVGWELMDALNHSNEVRTNGKIAASKSRSSSCVLRCVAADEQELHSWLTPLRAVTRPTLLSTSSSSTFSSSSVAGVRTAPLSYSNQDLHEVLMRIGNAAQESPLHALAACACDEACPDNVEAVLATAAWLLHTGCPIDSLSGKGHSAVQVAINTGNQSLANMLKQRGASVATLSSDDVIQLDTICRRLNRGNLERHEFRRFRCYRPCLPAPVKLRGCSYLSIHLQKHYFPESMCVEGFESPHIRITVETKSKAAVEVEQNVICPIFSSRNYVWWGSTWYLQTPLESLQVGTSVVLSLQQCPFGDFQHRTETSWGFLSIDVQRLDSGPIVIPFNGGYLEADVAVVKRERSLATHESIFAALHPS